MKNIKRMIAFIIAFSLMCSICVNAATFKDIDDTHWAIEYINLLSDKGILIGTDTGECLPEANITRAEIAALISRTYDADEYVNTNVNTFSDIPPSHWARKDIERLVAKSVILKSEYPEGYGPDHTLTRIEMVRLVIRWLEKEKFVYQNSKSTGFNDDPDLSATDKGFINVAKQYGIIAGYEDGSVRPYDNITRAEVFKILCVGLNEKSKPSYTIIYGGGSSGGSRPVPKADVSFSLSKQLHTDSEVEVIAKGHNVASLEWILRRWEDNAYNDVNLTEFIEGDLKTEGGKIRFKEEGMYELCAIAENSRGTKYEYTQKTEIFPVPSLTLDVPTSSIYENENAYIELLVNNNYDQEAPVTWKISKDSSESKPYHEYASGELKTSGGTIQFPDTGEYNISAILQDETKRDFTISQKIVVLPIPTIELSLQENAMTTEGIPVKITTSNMENELPVNWMIKKDGSEPESLNTYADGVLGVDGGVLTFNTKGSYEIIAEVTDITGKVFTYSTFISVYPTPVLSFELPDYTHTDTPITIHNNSENIEALNVVWTIGRDNADPSEYYNFVEGELDNSGGNIRFKEQGTYEVIATVTNEIGRTYQQSHTIIAYPVPQLNISVPTPIHTDTMFPIMVEPDAGGLQIEWLISKDGEPSVPYHNYISETLDNRGGNACLSECGQYRLTAKGFDKSGRCFEFTSSVEVYPIPEMQLNIPAYAHTDTQIDLHAKFSNISNPSVTWTIIKDNTESPYENIVSGTLTDNGGRIQFEEAGQHTIIATIIDGASRSFRYEYQIEIFSIPSINFGEFGLPSTAHTDTDIKINPTLENMDGLSVTWKISKNGGELEPYQNYVNGSLTDNGGMISFHGKGNYKLIAQITDQTGREYAYTAETKIYPVPTLDFHLESMNVHTDENVVIKSAFSEIDGYSVIWGISKDDGPEVDYKVYGDGTLNNEGGVIRISENGLYTVSATVIDDTGRVFSDKAEINVYPVITMSINAPKTAHTDDAITITTKTENIGELSIVWNVKSDAGDVSDNMILSNKGGEIQLTTQGDYIITATVTDSIGRSFETTADIKVYPVANLTFSIPEYTHTDRSFEVIPSFKDVTNAIWYMDGKEISMLTNTGGTLQIPEAGTHTVIAKMIDETGREFYHSNTIKVYPVPEVLFSRDSNAEFPLPAFGYVAKNITVVPSISNLGDLSIMWLIGKDGKVSKDYSTYVTGRMTNDGGNIAFPNKGSYEMTAKIVDQTEREFSYSETIIINTAPEISFVAPEHGYTNQAIQITSAGVKQLSTVWQISKDGGQPMDYSEYVTGTLSNNGGEIRFKEHGSYRIIMAVTDSTSGKAYSYTQKIKIVAMPDMSITLPEYAHVGDTITVSPISENLNNLDIIWKLNDLSYQSFADGILTNSGGKINFVHDGTYVLSAMVVDEYGREYTFYSNPILVYENQDVSFIAPLYAYSGENIDITVVSGTNITWTINDKTLDEFVQGTLNDDGGRIVFANAGNYQLTATVTDITGKQFHQTQTIRIYNGLTLDFSIPSTAYVGEDVRLIANAINADKAEITWTIAKDNGEPQNYFSYASGTLTNNGGTIQFDEQGIYRVIATTTDQNGRIYKAEKAISITGIPQVGITMTDNAYAGAMTTVATTNHYTEGTTVKWYISKDGGAKKAYAEYVTGSLNTNGGIIAFLNGGKYTIYAQVTDQNNNKFEFAANISVYDVADLQVNMPDHAYVQKDVKIVAEHENINGDVKWTIAKDGGEPQNYITFAKGTLTNNGGTIAFDETGIYHIVATIVDQAGKEYTANSSVSIANIPTAKIDIASEALTDQKLQFENILNDVVNVNYNYLLSKNNGEKMDLGYLANGSMDINGGSVTFISSGHYVMYLQFTDSENNIFEYSQQITVYDKPQIQVSIQSVGYVGIKNKVIVSSSNLALQNISWTISKDGSAYQSYLYYADGVLNNDGGTLKFDKAGTYNIKATTTDALKNQVISYDTITIHEVPKTDVLIPRTTHTDKTITVTALNENINSNTVTWYIKKDNSQPQPYTVYCQGTLNNTGGNIRFQNTGDYELIARITDSNGKVFEYKAPIRVYPVPTISPGLPSRVHIDTAFALNANPTNCLGPVDVTYKILKDGLEVPDNVFTSQNDGKKMFTQLGDYQVVFTLTDEVSRQFIYRFDISVYNLAPNSPEVTVNKTRTYKDGKYYVTLTATATDPDGDRVFFEYQNKPIDDYYPIGTTYVQVRTIDVYGTVSSWRTVPVTIINNAPTKPSITRTPDTISVSPGKTVNLYANGSTDSDGDPIHYEWDGKTSNNLYPLGKNVVTCWAVDNNGAKSVPAVVVFFVADEQTGGGMALDSADSVIIEEGIEGATITSYEFNVPEVSGHNSSNDYGQVRGFNIKTGAWELIEKISTTNGITMEKELPPDTYSKLELKYYTDHNCMYGKSNITYSVEFYFPEN